VTCLWTQSHLSKGVVIVASAWCQLFKEDVILLHCFRAVSKDKTSSKHWVCVGNMFLKLPADHTKATLNQGTYCTVCVPCCAILRVVVSLLHFYSNRTNDRNNIHWGLGAKRFKLVIFKGSYNSFASSSWHMYKVTFVVTKFGCKKVKEQLIKIPIYE